MTQVKGSTLVPRINYLKAHDPGGVWDRFLAGLTRECADQVTSGLMTHEWYPLDHYVQISRGIDRILGRGDLKLVWELGRYSAEEALKGIYKVFLKIGSPEFVVSAAATIWKQYYDTGRLSILKEDAADGRKHYRLTVQGFQQEDDAIWLSIGGWIERTLELSGARRVKVEWSRQGLRPGVNCEYACSWE
jgi:hypothetical protein